MVDDRQNLIGKRIRLILIGDRFYSGIVLAETDLMIAISDKFGGFVQVGKSAIISLEVVK
jgi:hypothetical protein